MHTPGNHLLSYLCQCNVYSYIQAIWKRLFKTKSGMERGTLYQLRNLINRRNVSSKPKSNVNASEDFLEIVVIAYVVAAAMCYLRMTSMGDIPDKNIAPVDTWLEDDSTRAAILETISWHIVNEYIDLATTFQQPEGKAKKVGSAYDYTCEVLSLGLLFLDFKDTVREGDGDRDLRLWKYLMLIFKATGHRNYAAEAFTLLSQYHIILPPNLAEQLKWSRFVNVHGLPGHNISCDLHMEHLNHLVKVAIEGLGANKSQKAIIRVGKAVGSLATIIDSFDREVGVSACSGKHSDKSMKKDLAKIVEQLLQQDMFRSDTKTSHRSFKNIQKNIITKLSEKKVKQWMIDRFVSAM